MGFITPRSGSEKARIWAICDRLYAERGALPSGREVVDIYKAEGGKEGTGFTQYSHWKKARISARAAEDRDAGEPGDVDFAQLSVRPDGALVLPPEMRAAMLLGPEGRVSARVEDGELRVIAPMAMIRKVQRLVAERDQGSGSVVDELIAERRAEARRELEAGDRGA
jgi:hypothetical protein